MTHMPFARRRLLLGASLALAVPTVFANEPGYPSRAIRLVIPFAPGGPSDHTGRIIGDSLAARLGQPIVVENRPGGGGILAAGQVARATPDGYTIMLGVTGSHGIAGALRKDLGYDALRDFEPIGKAVIYANAIVVSPDTPAKDLPSLIQLIKSGDPRYKTYGTDGAGTASHLTFELLKQRGGFESEAVQYKGAAPLLTDVAGGFVKVGITGLPTAETFIAAGRVHLIAVTTERDLTGKGYKSIAEQGFPGFQAAPFSGFFAPKGTPKPIVDKLANELEIVMRDPKVLAQLSKLGLQATPLKSEEFRRDLEQEISKWTEAVKAAKITQ